jgi:hypothetical protein
VASRRASALHEARNRPLYTCAGAVPDVELHFKQRVHRHASFAWRPCFQVFLAMAALLVALVLLHEPLSQDLT